MILSKSLDFPESHLPICEMKGLDKGPPSSRPYSESVELGLSHIHRTATVCCTQSSLDFCQTREGTGHSPQDHQPTLSPRKFWKQPPRSHFPSDRLHARRVTLPVWAFLYVNILLQMINVLPIRGGSCQLFETRAFSWGWGHAWRADVSREARGGSQGWKEGRRDGRSGPLLSTMQMLP